jgi:tRNA-splicing ligase RtcB
MAGMGNPLTCSSSCHGAGRARSRIKSLKAWEGRNTIEYMRQQGVIVRASWQRTVAEEMPDAYKNVDLVVEAVEGASLACKIARLKPYLVLKG